MHTDKLTSLILLASFAALGGCMPGAENTGAADDKVTSAAKPVNTATEDRAILAEHSESARNRFSGLTFEAFENRVYREPFDGGKYIVDGDTGIINKKLLREFFNKNVKTKPPSKPARNAEFIIHTVGGAAAIWPTHLQRQLSYCVSDQFGARHTNVVNAMQQAASAWEQAADIDFIYRAAQDNQCNPANDAVLFDVRPVDTGGQYLARAFFPHEQRPRRNVLIDESSFQLGTGSRLSLTGILRHELGHTIGARHEHTRPDSGRCFEDSSWQPLTNYDAFSVMHYPHCGGLGDWSLALTHKDQNGAACVYGAAKGFTIDPEAVNAPEDCAGNRGQPAAGSDEIRFFEAESVALNEERRYPDFPVAAGSRFLAELTPSGDNPGDPDLYLKFDKTPLRALEYDCRPFNAGARETCDVTVPAGISFARIMVHGFSAGNYDLKVSYIKPAGN